MKGRALRTVVPAGLAAGAIALVLASGLLATPTSGSAQTSARAGRLVTNGYWVVWYRSGKGLRGGRVVLAEPDGPQRILPGGTGEFIRGTVSPTGRYYVFGTKAETLPDQPDPGGIYAADLVTGKVRKILVPDASDECFGGYAPSYFWSSDGRYLFCDVGSGQKFATGRLTVPSGAYVDLVKALGVRDTLPIGIDSAEGNIYLKVDSRYYDVDLNPVTIQDISRCLFRVNGRLEHRSLCAWSHRLDRVAWIEGGRLLVNTDVKAAGATVIATNLGANTGLGGPRIGGWSPDGRLLVFQAGGAEGYWFLVPSRGGATPTRLNVKGFRQLRFFHDARHGISCRAPSAGYDCATGGHAGGVVALPSGKTVFSFASSSVRVSPDDQLMIWTRSRTALLWDGSCRGAARLPVTGHWVVRPGARARCI